MVIEVSDDVRLVERTPRGCTKPTIFVQHKGTNQVYFIAKIKGIDSNISIMACPNARFAGIALWVQRVILPAFTAFRFWRWSPPINDTPTTTLKHGDADRGAM